MLKVHAQIAFYILFLLAVFVGGRWFFTDLTLPQIVGHIVDFGLPLLVRWVIPAWTAAAVLVVAIPLGRMIQARLHDPFVRELREEAAEQYEMANLERIEAEKDRKAIRATELQRIKELANDEAAQYRRQIRMEAEVNARKVLDLQTRLEARQRELDEREAEVTRRENVVLGRESKIKTYLADKDAAEKSAASWRAKYEARCTRDSQALDALLQGNAAYALKILTRRQRFRPR